MFSLLALQAARASRRGHCCWRRHKHRHSTPLDMVPRIRPARGSCPGREDGGPATASEPAPHPAPVPCAAPVTGTTRADGETVGFETEGTAIYDTMCFVKNEASLFWGSGGCAPGHAPQQRAGLHSGFGGAPQRDAAALRACHLLPVAAQCRAVLHGASPLPPAGAHRGRGRGHRPVVHAAVGGREGQALHAGTRHRHAAPAARAAHGAAAGDRDPDQVARGAGAEAEHAQHPVAHHRPLAREAGQGGQQQLAPCWTGQHGCQGRM